MSKKNKILQYITNEAMYIAYHIIQLYATPVRLNWLGSLYLLEPELKILDCHYKTTIQNLQRFHQNTPRAVVFLFAGCLHGRALVHSRQLSLLLMLCHLPTHPLNSHALDILTSASPSAKSGFQQVRDLCSLYDLPEPLNLLDNPTNKKPELRIILLFTSTKS